MPLWDNMWIPFDEDAIAGLLYNGENILPDPNISPERLQLEKEIINNKLQQLWGDKPMRGVDSIYGGKHGFGTTFKRVIPNPFQIPFMPIINPNMPFNRLFPIEANATRLLLGSGIPSGGNGREHV